MLILFLDFDGVLHPDPCPGSADRFEHAPRLARCLSEFARVGLVLSTAWRTVRRFDELLELLPLDLRPRVMGVTPVFGDFRARAALIPYRRQAECMQWMLENRLQDQAWLALDDRMDGFAPYCENLIACHPQRGFDADVRARLRTALLLHRQRSGGEVDLPIG